jgi:MSHA biogenesis protein MshL
MRKPVLTIVMLTAALLLGCESMSPVRDVSSIEEMQKTLDESVEQNRLNEISTQSDTPTQEISQALLPPLQFGGIATSVQEERFSIAVDKAPAREFFMGLVKGSRYNMVVHPQLEGEISLELRDVTVEEVMDVVRSVYGYSYKKTGQLYQVMPGGLRSEVFKVDYLNVQREGYSETQVSAGRVSDAGSSGSSSSNNSSSINNNNNNNNNNNENGSSSSGVVGTKIRTHAQSDFWKELENTLQLLIGNESGQSIVLTPQAGIVVVRAFPDELESVRDYLRKAELILRRQVIIEAKILEVELKDGFQAGIQWAALGKPASGKTITAGSSSEPLINVDDIAGVFSINAQLNDFTALIELLETQGAVQVLSSPRISTVNNQKAVIKVGSDEFFVTEVTNTTTVSSGSTSNNPTVELTPFFSGISLDVTPQISADDEVILHIHPSISEVKDQQKEVAFGDAMLNLPLALSTIRETDSIVFSQSGQVVVIGGLMQNLSRDVDAGTPYLQHIPFLGGMFKQKRQESVKSELVILLKPVVMGTEGWNLELQKSSDRFEQMRSSINRGRGNKSGQEAKQ